MSSLSDRFPRLVRAALRAVLPAVLAAAVVVAPPARGEPVLSEVELKAALVFNFARYVEWPDRAFASADAPFVICLAGGERFAPAFAALEGRTLHRRPVRVRTDLSADLRGCHVAFIPEAQRRVSLALKASASQPVLTVGDGEAFIDQGGAIGIVPGDDRLQFEVNRDALERAGLKASSQLLKLARAIIGDGG